MITPVLGEFIETCTTESASRASKNGARWVHHEREDHQSTSSVMFPRRRLVNLISYDLVSVWLQVAYS